MSFLDRILRRNPEPSRVPACLPQLENAAGVHRYGYRDPLHSQSAFTYGPTDTPQTQPRVSAQTRLGTGRSIKEYRYMVSWDAANGDRFRLSIAVDDQLRFLRGELDSSLEGGALTPVGIDEDGRIVADGARGQALADFQDNVLPMLDQPVEGPTIAEQAATDKLRPKPELDELGQAPDAPQLREVSGQSHALQL